MRRSLLLCLCLLLAPAVLSAAEDVKRDEQVVNTEEQTVHSDKRGENSADQSAISDEQVAKSDETSVNSEEPAGAKEMSGMSIVGNDEAPKSLYIVPWKSSEIGAETSLDTMLNEGAVPVDRDVFKRQLGFYSVSTEK